MIIFVIINSTNFDASSSGNLGFHKETECELEHVNSQFNYEMLRWLALY
jgi:hypothetical protein